MAKFDYSTLTDLHFFLLFVSYYFRKVHTIITSSSHGNVVYYHQKRLLITVSYIFCVSIAYESLPSFYIFSNSLRLWGVLDPTRVKVFKKEMKKVTSQSVTCTWNYFYSTQSWRLVYIIAFACNFAFHDQSLFFSNI